MNEFRAIYSSLPNKDPIWAWKILSINVLKLRTCCRLNIQVLWLLWEIKVPSHTKEYWEYVCGLRAFAERFLHLYHLLFTHLIMKYIVHILKAIIVFFRTLNCCRENGKSSFKYILVPFILHPEPCINHATLFCYII